MSTRAQVRAQLRAVPAAVSRSHIEEVIGRFLDSYPVRDVEARLSLFADEAQFDDPAGLRVASNKAELRGFFQQTIASGFSIRFLPQRLVVSGNEALQVAEARLQIRDTEPVRLLLYLHFAFGDDGRITQLRTFFDEGCLRPPTAD